MIGLLPKAWQAWVWYFWHVPKTDPHSSHWRLNSYRDLRDSARIPLKDAARMIDALAAPESVNRR
jgi:hypothetical protein